jgi:DNA-binding NtrC family response regulator
MMSHNKPVVYVVDDEKVIAETLAMILNQAGFFAVAFEDPRQALAAACSPPPPNLLLSDVVMPEMSGIELAIQFHQSYPECRVLLFSGQAATSSLLEVARSKGHDFEVLAKPVHPADLLAKLRVDSQRNKEVPTEVQDNDGPAGVPRAEP